MISPPPAGLHSYRISLPVELTRAGTRSVSQTLRTHNVSARGVLMNCPSCPIEIGQEVEYLVTLPAHSSGSAIRLRCQGHVIRRDPALNVIAVSIERHEFISDSSAAVRAL